MIKVPPVEMEAVCQILGVQVHKSLSFTEEFLSFIFIEKKLLDLRKVSLAVQNFSVLQKFLFLDIFTKTFQHHPQKSRVNPARSTTPLLLFDTHSLRRYRCAAASAGALK